MITAVKDSNVDGSEIEACSDGEAFCKLLPRSDPQEASTCFTALMDYCSTGYSAAQNRVSTRDTCGSPASSSVRLAARARDG